MPWTPIAGIAYACAPATGADDLALLESGLGLDAAIALVGGRARTSGGDRIAATELPVGDLDAIVVELRRAALGDRMIAEGRCGACGSAIDIAFALSAFQAHHSPRRPRNVAPEPDGWWTLRGATFTFRIPSGGDVLAASASESPADVLAELCFRGGPGARERRAAERAMALLAPTLSAEVQGTCPECKDSVGLWADVRALCLADLRFGAGCVLEEVHLLASAYHWRERDILGMVSSRRAAYADCVRAARGQALPAEAFGG